jgi:hypothetical protein
MKLKIDNETLAQEFFEDSLLLGIVAPIKDYQFSWQLNQILGFNFRVNNDFEIELTKKQRKYFFSIYEYAVPSTCLVHYLYKHLDFLWLIKGETVSTEELKSLMQSIKSLPGVQLVNEMTNEKIKHKQHLIF